MADGLVTARATIRRGDPDDAPALRALGEVVVPPTYGAHGAAYVDLMLREWWAVDRLAASLARIPHWVAEDAEGRLVGVANLGEHEGEPTMWKLYVHPDHQGTGLGSRLLAEVVAAAAGRPLLLEVVEGNDRAEAFYRRHGFEELRREPERVAPEVTLIWMRRSDG
jgi:ribosomal protein S18 acetylase RimI-like enzyme